MLIHVHIRIHIYVIKLTSFFKYVSPHEIDNDDVYLDKLQTRGVKKSILYM
jgi:hypothetical protein